MKMTKILLSIGGIKGSLLNRAEFDNIDTAKAWAADRREKTIMPAILPPRFLPE